MTTLKTISETLATALVNIGGSGLDVTPFPTQGATAPFAELALSSWNVEGMGRRGTKTYTFSLRLFVAQTARPQDAYWSLLEFMDSTGSRSVDLGVWDADLSGISCHVADARVLGDEEVDGLGQYGAEFTVIVAKKGTD